VESVLVLDDEPQLLHLMVRILERAGCRVHAVSRGDEAARWLRERGGEIDAVVADMAVQPNGVSEVIDALDALREHPGRVGIVVTSGDLLEPDLQAPLERSHGVFLRKPFVPRALLRAVQDAARQARTEEP